MKYIFWLTLALNFQIMSSQSLQNCIQLFKAKKIIEAKTSFKSYLRSHPTDKVALEYMGDIAFQQEKWDEASKYFKTLVNEEEDNAVYHYKYAGAIGLKAKNNKLKALFLIDDIKFHFKKAAELDAEFIDARKALVQLYIELPAALGGSTSKAKAYAEQLKPLDTIAYREALQYIEKTK